jgi:hypothetical protein
MIEMRRHKETPSAGAAAFLFALGLLLLAARPASAVTYLEQTERLQLINAFLLDYRPAAAPLLPQKSIIEVQGELIPMPVINNKVGAKNEPDNAPPVIPRARVRYVGSWGLMLGATGAPDVKVQGFSAPALGAEAGIRFALGGVHGELRAFTLSSVVTGPITESGASDEFDVTNSGADLRLGLAMGSLMPYLGSGKGHTKSTLTVASDGAQLDAGADYQYVFGGLSYYLGALAFTYEQHRTEDFLDHFILAVSVRF